ncbi:MAG: putative transrane protein [Rhizobium sp.]|nr:putative transrane protein [Rhizobium sp.]
MRVLRASLIRMKDRLARLLPDRSGASAVEFAFLAPILIAIYVSSFEITEGYNSAGKVLKAAGTVADIVARQSTVDKTFLNEMIDTVEATIAPHTATGLKLKISGITIDSAGNAKVLWSWNQAGNAPYVKGSAVTVPDDLKTPSSFLVHSEISVPHTLLLFLSSGAGVARDARSITLSRDFYYRQRLSEDIPCIDCS